MIQFGNHEGGGFLCDKEKLIWCNLRGRPDGLALRSEKVTEWFMSPEVHREVTMANPRGLRSEESTALSMNLPQQALESSVHFLKNAICSPGGNRQKPPSRVSVDTGGGQGVCAIDPVPDPKSLGR